MNAVLQVSRPAQFRQVSELVVTFEQPTVADTLLVVAYIIESVAIAAITDNIGTSPGLWRRANSSARPDGGRMECWYRNGGQPAYRGPTAEHGGGVAVVAADAGVTAVTARLCNGATLGQGIGLAVECRPGTKRGDALQRLANLLHEAGL